MQNLGQENTDVVSFIMCQENLRRLSLHAWDGITNKTISVNITLGAVYTDQLYYHRLPNIV